MRNIILSILVLALLSGSLCAKTREEKIAEKISDWYSSIPSVANPPSADVTLTLMKTESAPGLWLYVHYTFPFLLRLW